MFVIILTYKAPLTTIDQFLPLHVEYLKEQYRLGRFIASGRRRPRVGGVILSNLDNKEAVNTVINSDPFKINGVADYEIIEFLPSMTSKELEFLIN
jgi:Uncharacterized protein conserved in bacteria